MVQTRPAQRRARSLASAAVAALVLVGGAALAAPAGADKPGAGHCARIDKVVVKGAERTETACLTDLTTTGTVQTGHTNPADWAGLHAAGTVTPRGVPGIQVDGYFPDTSTTNTNHGWNHDSQFVIRIPDAWNGKVVITGAPGVRGQYANDLVIGDWVLAQGYAFASTDKGNMGASFWDDGSTPGGSIREWHQRVTELAVATRDTVTKVRAQRPGRMYMAGISNGGYLTRWQLENHPELYDGGVDWEGTLWAAGGRHPLLSLPVAVAWTSGAATDEDMYEAGFARGSEFLWPYHAKAYWGVTQKIYRAEFDPDYDPGCPGASAGSTLEQVLAPCPSDAVYDYASRPASVHRAVERVALTGRIGRPLITLHGDLDALLPASVDSDVYDRMIESSGRDRLHRYYTVRKGTHVDGLYDSHPDRLRPVLPCYRSAFDALVAWVERGVAPPADRTVGEPADGDVVDSCALGSGAAVRP